MIHTSESNYLNSCSILCSSNGRIDMCMYSNQFVSTMTVSFLAGAFARHIDSIVYDSCAVVLIAQAKLI